METEETSSVILGTHTTEETKLADTTVQDLAELLASHHTTVQTINSQLLYLQEQQLLLLQKILQDNTTHQEALVLYNLPHMFENVSHYTQKAQKLSHDMRHIRDRTEILKTRVARLVQECGRRCRKRSLERARQEELERHLIARPAWHTDE